jgi:hypothetical protein
LRPALASIGGAGEIGGGLRRAGNDHQRIGLREARRNLVLDVGLTAQHLLITGRRILAADEEVALLGDRQRFLGTGRWQRGERKCERGCACEFREFQCHVVLPIFASLRITFLHPEVLACHVGARASKDHCLGAALLADQL